MATISAFEENGGQETRQVRFLARAGGVGIFATPRQIVTTVRRPDAQRSVPVRMCLPGRFKLSGLDILPGRTHYFGLPTKDGVLSVRNYRAIEYRADSGLLLRLHFGEGRTPQYEWVVPPRLKPDEAWFRVAGADRLYLAQNGDLLIEARGIQFVHRAPFLYQVRSGVRTRIRGGFQKLGRNKVGFHVGPYDRSLPLVIDPVIGYAVALGAPGVYKPPVNGGNFGDKVTSIAVDSLGAAYIAGDTYAPRYPFPSPRQPGDQVMFVAKLSPRGAIEYLTLFNSWSQARAIAVDGSGSAYITGATSSTISVAPPTMRGGPGGGESDAFVAKLDPTGGRLVYNTYLGGSRERESALAIAVDTAGQAYIAGSTPSADYPVTPGAFQTSLKARNGSSAFVTKLNSAGDGILFSTLLGGSTAEAANAIAVDSAGNAFVAGSAFSPDFPVTPGAFQSELHRSPSGPAPGAFVTKLSADGQRLLYSTFLAGSGNDYATAIALDNEGNAYLTGSTASEDFPVTAAAYKKQIEQGGKNVFLAALDGTGSNLLYSTYFGPASTRANAIAVDGEKNVHITGQTSGSLPALNAPQSSFYVTGCPHYTQSGVTPDSWHPCANAFAAALNPAGSALVYATYLNGYRVAEGLSIAVDGSGGVYVGGSGELSLAASDPGATGNAFVVKLLPGKRPPSFTSDSIVNAASFAPGLVQPGGLATLFCTGLTNIQGTVSATAFPLPLELAAVSVTMGGLPAPLLAVADFGGYQQINVQVPAELRSLEAADVSVRQNGASGMVTQAKMFTSAPGIFTFDGVHGAIQRAGDNKVVSSANPAEKGGIITIYATGLGPVEPEVPSGTAAPLSPLSWTKTTPIVEIDGQAAEVLFSGLAPGAAGLYQINARVPASVRSGEVEMTVSLPPVWAQLPPTFDRVSVSRTSRSVKLFFQ